MEQGKMEAAEREATTELETIANDVLADDYVWKDPKTRAIELAIERD